MTDLAFTVTGAAAGEPGLEPHLVLALRIACRTPAASVQALLLRCQVRIEATRRRYDDEEASRLEDLFGARARWSETVRSLLWANVPLHVPGFTGETTTGLPLPCGFDFSLAWVKYLDAVRADDLPLRLLFSGTIFHRRGEGLEVEPISWQQEATFSVPAAVCQEVRERSFAGSVPLALRRDVFDRLYAYRRRNGLPTWEHTLERLLAGEGLP
jgi:hypothetical protein